MSKSDFLITWMGKIGKGVPEECCHKQMNSYFKLCNIVKNQQEKSERHHLI